MKKLLTILFLFVSLIASATNYYVRTDGSNAHNGLANTSGGSWLTLAYACSQVPSGSHTINVGAGTLTETAVSNLAAGVSIIGAGITTIIKAGYAAAPLLSLTSGSEGTNGNQTISNLKFDGDNLTGLNCIYIVARSNVKIHGCTFIDFSDWGVTFNGRIDETNAAPTIYATGNEFYNNTVTNCSKYATYGRGELQIGGQDSMLIHDNIMGQVGRTTGTNGYVIKYWSNGYLKGCKIYNNTITKEPYDNVTYDFAVELWNVQGLEMFNNTIIGNTDLNILSKGTYAYSVDFHNNNIGPVTEQAYFENGIALEAGCYDVVIRNNYFQNVFAIYTYAHAGGKVFNNINIYNNILKGIRFTHFGSADNSGIYSNWNIWNNTLYYSSTATSNRDGIVIPGCGTTTNFSIKNNIIYGFPRASIQSELAKAGSTIDIVSIENNDFYGNGYDYNGYGDTPNFTTITPTNVTNQNNITTDPLFVSTSDFHLQSGSPCINAGVNVGLTTDYRGYHLVGVSDIGTYEYGTYIKKGISAGGGKCWGKDEVPYGF